MVRQRRNLFIITVGLLSLVGLWSYPLADASAQQATLTVTPTSIATAIPSSLLVWWPAPLYPTDKAVVQQLQDILAAFEQTNGTAIKLRVKRVEGLGGLYQMFYQARLVAPDVVPDVMLVRRIDLLRIIQNAMATPFTWETDFTEKQIDDWFSAGLALGRVGDADYGIPYTLEIQHALTQNSEPPHLLDELLSLRMMYLFPANANGTVNPTLVAQYLAAGGQLRTTDGRLTLDSAALETTLKYYEQAVQAGLLDATVLNYSVTNQYLPAFMGGKNLTIQVDSTTYLNQIATSKNGRAYRFSALLTNNPSVQMTSVNGWCWLVTTSDPEQRAEAFRLIAWMMSDPHYSTFTQRLGVLPATRMALRSWQSEYARFATSLLDGEVIPQLDTLSPVVANALQAAFEAVITKKQTAAQATQDALALLNSAAQVN